MTDCTPSTPWRTTADTTLAAFRAELAGSPVLAEADALCDAASPYGRLYLAHSEIENRDDTVGILIDPEQHNNLALRPRGYPEERGQRNGFAIFARYQDCLSAWRRRLGDVRLCYLDAVTMLDYATCYNPATDAHPITGVVNNPARYCDQLLTVINRLPLPTEVPPVATYTTPVPGLPKAITTTFPVKLAILPPTQTNQRPGHPFNGGAWDFYTQHETGNTRAGADAEMHRRYLEQGAPDANGTSQQLSYHVTVDDKQAIVLVPFDEVAWHAGDSGGPGNFDSVACELCVNADGDRARSRANAEELAAAVLKARGLGADRVVQHNKWSGKDCPHEIRKDNYWPAFVAGVARHLAPAPPSVPALDYTPGWTEATATAVWGDAFAPQYVFNPAGTVSPIWLKERVCSPLVHVEEDAAGKHLFVFASGETIGRLNAGEAYRVLAG